MLLHPLDITISSTRQIISYIANPGVQHTPSKKDRNWKKGRKGVCSVFCAMEKLDTKIPETLSDCRCYLKDMWSMVPKFFQTGVCYHWGWLRDSRWPLNTRDKIGDFHDLAFALQNANNTKKISLLTCRESSKMGWPNRACCVFFLQFLSVRI